MAHVNSTTAAQYNINQGQEVVLYNRNGMITVIVTIDESIPDSTVAVEWGWGNQCPENNVNVLIDDTEVDPITGTTCNRLFRCTIQP